MLSVDSIVESHLHSHGEWTVESVGLNYDVKLHSAVPQENFERLLASRASNRQVVENFPVLRSELTGLAALKEQQLIRDGVPPDSTSTHL